MTVKSAFFLFWEGGKEKNNVRKTDQREGLNVTRPRSLVSVGFLWCVSSQTVLAAIIMVNLLGMFRQLRDIPALWRTSKIELVSFRGFRVF